MSLRDLLMTVQQVARLYQSFFMPPRILHRDKDRGADCEIHQQAPVFLEKRVPRHRRQMWHEQEVDRVACEHGHERVEKILHRLIGAFPKLASPPASINPANIA
jgi:hypothetical protein